MKFIAATFIYLGFFGLIAFSVWHTKSVWPLFLILMAPTIETSTFKED